MLDAVPGGRGRSQNDVRARVSDPLVLIPFEDFSYANGWVEKAECSWASTWPSTLKEAAWLYTHATGTWFNIDEAAGLNDFLGENTQNSLPGGNSAVTTSTRLIILKYSMANPLWPMWDGEVTYSVKLS